MATDHLRFKLLWSERHFQDFGVHIEPCICCVKEEREEERQRKRKKECTVTPKSVNLCQVQV
jgi:hypothetical protein